jgi:hypothetical protein
VLNFLLKTLQNLWNLNITAYFFDENIAGGELTWRDLSDWTDILYVYDRSGIDRIALDRPGGAAWPLQLPWPAKSASPYGCEVEAGNFLYILTSLAKQVSVEVPNNWINIWIGSPLVEYSPHGRVMDGSQGSSPGLEIHVCPGVLYQRMKRTLVKSLHSSGPDVLGFFPTLTLCY